MRKTGESIRVCEHLADSFLRGARFFIDNLSRTRHYKRRTTIAKEGFQMKLRGIEFGHVLDASGARNFDGSGWWYHRLGKLVGLSFDGSTFVAKTTTAYANPGNMALKSDGMTPKSFMPDCIWMDSDQGIALNAVGLSGFGAEHLFENAGWEKRTEPFFLSFMALLGITGSTPNQQTYEFSELVRRYVPNFRAPIGIQLNVSCPNVGALMVPEVRAINNVHEQLDILACTGVPLMLKISVTTPIRVVLRMAAHAACDAICVSNTVPFGALSEKINWIRLFGTVDPKHSPLAKYGGGGLSGAPLLALTEAWVRDARAAQFQKAINAGGGILCPADADRLIDAGADSVFLGSIAFLRPWQVARTIRHANKRFKNR